jgi:hypothetical protein
MGSFTTSCEFVVVPALLPVLHRAVLAIILMVN